MSCRICRSSTQVAFTTTVLRRYKARFDYCDNCGFLHANDPFWLPEAYDDAITAADTGLLARNVAISRRLIPLLYLALGRDATYLDVAGGYGILTRLMRDAGFDYYWSDKYCENLLARGFEAPVDGMFSAISAFEVMEHVVDPFSFVADSLEATRAHTFIFSTELFTGRPPEPGSWWYYAFDFGQHISFYQRRTLRALAERLGLRFCSNGSFHMYSDLPLNGVVYRVLTDPLLSRIASLVIKRCARSRTMADHDEILARLLNSI
jgi:Methyltransferase domain